MTRRYGFVWIVLTLSVSGLVLAPLGADGAEPSHLHRYQGPPSPAGFAVPEDVSALLAYRLPTWGFRTWQLGFNLDGNQSDNNGSKNFGSNLTSSLGARHESEDWAWSVHTGLSGSYSNRSGGSHWTTHDTRALQGRATLTGDLNYYFRGDWSVSGGLAANYIYAEYRRSDRSDGEVEWRYHRDTQFRPQLGLAYGRVRDVTPVLRAQRISERLVALGRSPLNRTEVLALADVISQRSGYLTVFDRSDKYFWSDVLDEIAGDVRLSPYEVLYLTDVLAEALGDRQEGWQIGVYAATDRIGGDFSRNVDLAGVHLVWSHNLSLAHQVSVRGSGFSDWHEERDELRGTLGFEYLWVLTDRCVWSNQVHGSYHERDYKLSDREGPDSRSRSVALSSDFSLYLEDNLVLSPRGTVVVYDRTGSDTSRVAPGDGTYEWSFQIGLTWYLDKVLN